MLQVSVAARKGNWSNEQGHCDQLGKFFPEVPALPENTYYIEDILGFDVITDEGKTLGKLDDVFNTGANDIYQVGEILLPATKEVILKVDLEKKQILVHLLKGMI